MHNPRGMNWVSHHSKQHWVGLAPGAGLLGLVLTAGLAVADRRGEPDTVRKDYLYAIGAAEAEAAGSLPEAGALEALREAKALYDETRGQRDDFIRLVRKAARLFPEVSVGDGFGKAAVVAVEMNRYGIGIDGFRFRTLPQNRSSLVVLHTQAQDGKAQDAGDVDLESLPQGFRDFAREQLERQRRSRVRRPYHVYLVPSSRVYSEPIVKELTDRYSPTAWGVDHVPFITEFVDSETRTNTEHLFLIVFPNEAPATVHVSVAQFNYNDDPTGLLHSNRAQTERDRLRPYEALFGLVLEEAPEEMLERGVRTGERDLVDKALAAGADIKARAYLPLACGRAHPGPNYPLMTYLISKGADVNKPGPDGSLPLHTLLRVPERGTLSPHEQQDRTMSETVALFVRSGAEVNGVDPKTGLTPLMSAVTAMDALPVTVWTLLQLGADPTLKAADGRTAADMINKHANPDELWMLTKSP